MIHRMEKLNLVETVKLEVELFQVNISIWIEIRFQVESDVTWWIRLNNFTLCSFVSFFRPFLLKIAILLNNEKNVTIFGFSCKCVSSLRDNLSSTDENWKREKEGEKNLFLISWLVKDNNCNCNTKERGKVEIKSDKQGVLLRWKHQINREG